MAASAVQTPIATSAVLPQASNSTASCLSSNLWYYIINKAGPDTAPACCSEQQLIRGVSPSAFETWPREVSGNFNIATTGLVEFLPTL